MTGIDTDDMWGRYNPTATNLSFTSLWGDPFVGAGGGGGIGTFAAAHLYDYKLCKIDKLHNN
ncbi:MAG: hypothetical protein RIE87_17200 [Rhodospirillales bacterium]